MLCYKVGGRWLINTHSNDLGLSRNTQTYTHTHYLWTYANGEDLIDNLCTKLSYRMPMISNVTSPLPSSNGALRRAMPNAQHLESQQPAFTRERERDSRMNLFSLSALSSLTRIDLRNPVGEFLIPVPSI